MEPDIQAQTTL